MVNALDGGGMARPRADQLVRLLRIGGYDGGRVPSAVEGAARDLARIPPCGLARSTRVGRLAAPAVRPGCGPNWRQAVGQPSVGSAAAAAAVHRLRVGGASVRRCRGLGTGAPRQATLRLDGGAGPAMVSAADSRASDTRHG